MTEVGSADLSRLLQSKRNECSSIVTSRKRKLRELFAVATQVESLPHPVLANPDAPTTTPAEWQFLQANDIFQGKTLNESNIPQRPTLSLDALKKSLAKSTLEASVSLPLPVLEEGKEDATPRVQDGSLAHKAPTIKPDAGNPPQIVSITKIASKPTPVACSPHAAPHPTRPVPPSTNGLVKPVATLKPTKPVPTVTNNNQPLNSTGAIPTPVAIPSGVKALPQSETKSGTKQETPSEAVLPQAKAPVTTGSNLLSIKPPTDGSRAPDALSSPGSTAQSATTPAVHDVSANTSPENEGPQYVEPAEQPTSDRDVETKDIKAPDCVEEAAHEDLQTRALNARPNSAEAQLLQESIGSRTAVAVPVPEQKATPPAVARKDFPATPKPAKPTLVVETKLEQLTSREETQSKPVAEMMDAEGKEIPDSQEEVQDQMDIDVPEPNGDVQTQIASPIKKENSAPETPSTPVPPETTHRDVSQVPERAVTRVSSGALRLKSVNEIVGVTPRPTPTLDRTVTNKSFDNQLTPLTSTPQSPSIRHRNIPTHRRERSRSQPSTVLFGKQPKRGDEKTMVPNQRDTIQATDDYYTPLFVQGFAGSSSWMQPIEKILFTANKTVATPDANLAIQDHQACKVLRRVYHLQQHDKWSLRQPKRCPEPTRPPSQWDVMLQEMKWMRTDFREERKWKRAVAKNLVYACAEWHESTPEERKALQVSAVIPSKARPAGDVSMADVDEDGADNHPTPDLVSSGDIDSPYNMDELTEDFMETVAPSAIFALQDDDVIFGLRRTPTADQLLEELPMYGPPLKVPKFDLTGPEYDPDAHWRRPALPLSKYVEGQMKLVSDGPPRKRSRFDYRNEDSDDENESVFAGNQRTSDSTVPPQTNEVALFDPEMRHIRERLFAGHQFRPPSEHPMPMQSFYECRSSSQWTPAEDDELRCLVREHSYNWSLISSLLSTKSLFMSGAERRTPWECFERWINLEGLPADMQKTQYFKAYNTRIEAAQRVIMQQHQLAIQQANSAGGAVTPVRRRHSTPLRVERRRNQKHLTLIDAMRKLAKKRETAVQKQQHTASQNAANKKTNETASQRPTKTPRDYSLLRWERDQALAEKMAHPRARPDATSRMLTTISQAAMVARAQGQVAQMAGNPAAAQAGQNGVHSAQAAAAAAAAVAGNNMNGRVNVPNQLAAAAAVAARPRMPMQSPANGMAGVPPHITGGLVPPTQMNGGQHNRIPQPMPQPNPQPDQRAAVQMQQAQQSPPATMRNGVNGVHGINQQSFINNAQAMMASFNATNGGNHSTPANGLHMPSGPAGSPAPRPQPQLPPGIANQLNQLEAQFPRQLATEHLTRAMMAQRQSAMNAAAGANGQPGLAGSIAATTSPHQYAALLRQQQQAQATSGSATPSVGK
ncbi:hypothetical protein B0J13DRAFT_540084 [Dactylonectria estremocensis]|uniref:Vacuolar import and degradation protein 21 n=1 Tax=Dactylonectria estremocensis TaxID=1079267 RepID=A0A9P9FBN3_9HYPO|nr:hypothetical protein B0J13DRAFT_540084 [Dactylonectria estremocensis]